MGETGSHDLRSIQILVLSPLDPLQVTHSVIDPKPPRPNFRTAEHQRPHRTPTNLPDRMPIGRSFPIPYRPLLQSVRCVLNVAPVQDDRKETPRVIVKILLPIGSENLVKFDGEPRGPDN